MKTKRQLVGLCLLLGSCLAIAQPVGPATGAFRITETLATIAGEDAANRIAAVIAPDEPITWEVYVPEHYDAGRPPGLMVYISPTLSGEMPNGWNRVMDDYNLVWVAANKSGNSETVGRRAILAQIAPTVVRRDYAINRERIYVTGLSGGGKMASMVATEHANLFKGGIFNCGVEFWRRATPRHIDLIRQNHYVFVTGTLDQALEPTKKAHARYLDAGVANSKLMVIRDMTHRNPNRFNFAEAVAYLDSRLEKAPE
jgi:hypothetical protein